MHVMHTTKAITIPGAIVAVVVLAAAVLQQFSTVEAAPPRNSDPRRAYYLTRTSHTGSEALSACDAGYHMASAFEIANPSALRYDASLGVVNADAGSGPPAQGGEGVGWSRSGGTEGTRNCGLWTSDTGEGPWASFTLFGYETQTPGLLVTIHSCAQPMPVWCIQD